MNSVHSSVVRIKSLGKAAKLLEEALHCKRLRSLARLLCILIDSFYHVPCFRWRGYTGSRWPVYDHLNGCEKSDYGAVRSMTISTPALGPMRSPLGWLGMYQMIWQCARTFALPGFKIKSFSVDPSAHPLKSFRHHSFSLPIFISNAMRRWKTGVH